MIRDDGLKKKKEKLELRGKYDPCQDGDFLELSVFFSGSSKKK